MAGRDDYDSRGLITMGNRMLREMTLPEDIAGLIEHYRRLDELSSALRTVRTRLEVAVVLSRVPVATSGMGTSPMAAEAVDRLRRALINVMALNVRAHSDT
jgi:hypothetical protein